jgi:glycosyltransferase involved in cell wall biosynthesis
MKKVFIVIPSPHPTGPIKGAYALANALVEEVSVTLVTLRAGPGASASIDPRVRQLSLAEVKGGWPSRMRAYRNLLAETGGREDVGSISMCFSADMANCASSAHAVTCVSVRGNLLKNYRLDYGLAGVPFAVGHLAALRKADHIVAITTAMASQIAFYARKAPVVIGNFIDEPALEPYRVHGAAKGGPFRFVFVGSLTERKQPMLALRAIQELKRRGIKATLDVIGSGPLSKTVTEAVESLDLRTSVSIHGHLADPYRIVAAADAMVLPSLSEGLPRSALEALHLGVPCVLRDVDGNDELIAGSCHGSLFHDDSGLSEKMLLVAERSRAAPGRSTLLESRFRQREQARRYLSLLGEAT